MLKRTALIFTTSLTVAFFCSAQNNNANKSKDVVGTWEGESVCTVRPSPCHDEHVIYEVTAGQGSKLAISADKVVDGERQNMGTIDCTYDGSLVHCPMSNGTWLFEVAKGKMTGELHLPDGKLFRKINVEKRTAEHKGK